MPVGYTTNMGKKIQLLLAKAASKPPMSTKRMEDQHPYHYVKITRPKPHWTVVRHAHFCLPFPFQSI